MLFCTWSFTSEYVRRDLKRDLSAKLPAQHGVGTDCKALQQLFLSVPERKVAKPCWVLWFLWIYSWKLFTAFQAWHVMAFLDSGFSCVANLEGMPSVTLESPRSATRRKISAWCENTIEQTQCLMKGQQMIKWQQSPVACFARLYSWSGIVR